MKGYYCTYMHFEEDRNKRVRDYEKEGRKIEYCRYYWGLGNHTPWSCSKGQDCEWAHDEEDMWAFSRQKVKDKKNRVWSKVVVDKGSDDHHDDKKKPAYGQQAQQSHERRQRLMAGTRKDGENKAAFLLKEKMQLMNQAAYAQWATTLLPLQPLPTSEELEATFLEGEEEAGKKESQAEEGAAAAEVTTETGSPHNDDVQQLALRRDAVKEVKKEDSGEEEKGMSSTGIVRSVMHYFSFGKEEPKEAATEVAGPEAEEGAVAVAATEEETTRQSPSS